MVKNPPASARDAQRCRFNPWVRKIPWSRKWQPTPIFVPGKSHEQRSLAGYSPWGHKRVGHDLVIKQQQQIMCLVEDKKNANLQWVELNTWTFLFSQIRSLEVGGCCSCFIGSVMSSWCVSESLSLSFDLIASWEQDWLPQL